MANIIPFIGRTGEQPAKVPQEPKAAQVGRNVVLFPHTSLAAVERAYGKQKPRLTRSASDE